jgi:hypothetical protein
MDYEKPVIGDDGLTEIQRSNIAYLRRERARRIRDLTVLLTGIGGGLLAGWYVNEGNYEVVTILSGVLVCGLTGVNLVIATSEWKKHPERLGGEALESALHDPKAFDRITRDLSETKKLGRPPFRVIFRYLAFCFILNLRKVAISALIAFCVRAFTK